MSADSPRRGLSSRCGGLSVPAIVPPQIVSDRSILDSAIGFINDVTLAHQPHTDPKDTITWARFESMADISDPCYGEDWELEGNVAPPLLLILGYGMGVQVWAIPANGEAIEVLSWRHGTVTALRVLPTPSVPTEDAGRRADELMDAFAEKRPLMAMCDGGSSKSSGGPPPQYCAVNFISLKTGSQVKTIKFKNAVLDILANRNSIAITFHERIAVFDARTLEDRLSITTCYPSPGINPNPVAMGSRWLAYAEHKLLHSKRSGGGCDGEGVASYTATMLNAAKSFGKGLRELGEQVAAGLTGTTSGGGSGSNSKNSSFDSSSSGDMRQPGVVTIMDIKFPIKEISPTSGTPISINGGDPFVAHFIAHSEAIVAMEFDNSGMLLTTADKRGHDFHVFRIQPHPVGSSLAAVHHLYVLHRGDTSAKVQNIACSLDSRWIAISTLRGTTHVFPITPYGGAMGVRTHTSLHVVNKLSRFHRSAGLSAEGRSSSPISHSESTTFSQSLTPYHNPTRPPYTRPTVVLPLAQLRQPFVLGSPPGSAVPLSKAGVGVGAGSGSSQRQRLSSLSDDNGKPLSVCAIFAKSRSWLLDPPMVTREAPHRIQCKAVDSLFVMAGHGALIQYDLDTKLASNIAKEKICDETPIELEVEAKAQWNLGRKEGSQEIMPPLSVDNWLVKDRNSCMLTDSTRQFDDSDDRADSWLSQVEIITHAGPHRRLWMGPQFVFKTYNTPSGSNLSHIEAESVEIGASATTAAAAAAARAERSSPLNMPLSATARASVPVLIESGSYSSIEQSPKLMDRFRHEHLDSDFSVAHGDSRLKEDLADAMRESPSVSKDVTGRLSCDAAYDCAPYYDALAEHGEDDSLSSFDSTTHRSAAAALAHALPNIYSYAAYSSVEASAQPRSIEKVVNPLGTVTTITAGMTSELSTDILDEVVSQLAAEDCVIHENCDESLFRPVVAIFCDEKSRIAGEEARRQQELCQPPEVIGTKLIVPVIDKERDDELCKKEKQKSTVGVKSDRKSCDSKLDQTTNGSLSGDKQDQCKFAEMSQRSSKAQAKDEECETILREKNEREMKEPDIAILKTNIAEAEREDCEMVVKSQKMEHLQTKEDNKKDNAIKKITQREQNTDWQETKAQHIVKDMDESQKAQKKSQKKGSKNKDSEHSRSTERELDEANKVAKSTVKIGRETVDEKSRTENKNKEQTKNESQRNIEKKEDKKEGEKTELNIRPQKKANKSEREAKEVVEMKSKSLEKIPGEQKEKTASLEKELMDLRPFKEKEDEKCKKTGIATSSKQKEETTKGKKLNERDAPDKNAQTEKELETENINRSQEEKIADKEEAGKSVQMKNKNDVMKHAKREEGKIEVDDITIGRKVQDGDEIINVKKEEIKEEQCEGNGCKIDIKKESNMKEKKVDKSVEQADTKQNKNKADDKKCAKIDEDAFVIEKNDEVKAKKYEKPNKSKDKKDEKKIETNDDISEKNRDEQCATKSQAIKIENKEKNKDYNVLEEKKIAPLSLEKPTKQTADNAKLSANKKTADTENLSSKVKIKPKDKPSRKPSEEENEAEGNKNETSNEIDSKTRPATSKISEREDIRGIIVDIEKNLVKTEQLNVADLEDSLIELNDSTETNEEVVKSLPKNKKLATVKTIELTQPVDIYGDGSTRTAAKGKKKQKSNSSTSNSECDEVIEVTSSKSKKSKKRLQDKKSSISSEESFGDITESFHEKKQNISQTLFSSFSEIMEKEVSPKENISEIESKQASAHGYMEKSKSNKSTELKDEHCESKVTEDVEDKRPKPKVNVDNSKIDKENSMDGVKVLACDLTSTNKQCIQIKSVASDDGHKTLIDVTEKKTVIEKNKKSVLSNISTTVTDTIQPIMESKGAIKKQVTKKSSIMETKSSGEKKESASMGENAEGKCKLEELTTKPTDALEKPEYATKKLTEDTKNTKENIQENQKNVMKTKEIIKNFEESNNKTADVIKKTDSQPIVGKKSLADVLKGDASPTTPKPMKPIQTPTSDTTKACIKTSPTAVPITEQPKKSKNTNSITPSGALLDKLPIEREIKSTVKSPSTCQSKTDLSSSNEDVDKPLLFFDKFSPEHKKSPESTKILQPFSVWKSLNGADMINQNLAETTVEAAKETNFPSLGGRMAKINSKKVKTPTQTEEKLIPVESAEIPPATEAKVNKKNRKKFHSNTLDEICMLKSFDTLPPLPVLEPLELQQTNDAKIPNVDKSSEAQVESQVSLINFESPQQEKRSLTQHPASNITPTPRGFSEQNLIFALCGSLHYENENSSPRERSSTTDYKSLIENINDEHYMSLEKKSMSATNANDKSTSSNSSSSASEDVKVLAVKESKSSEKQKQKQNRGQTSDDDDDDADDDDDGEDDDVGIDDDENEDDDVDDDDDDDADDGNIHNDDEELQPLISITESKLDYFLKVIKDSATELPQTKKKYHSSIATAGSTTTDDSEGPMAATTPSDDNNYQRAATTTAASSGNKLKTKKLEHKINLIAAIEAATSSSTSSAEEESGLEGGSGSNGGGCSVTNDASAAVVSMSTLAASLAANTASPSASTALQQNASKKKTKRRKR